MNEPQSKSYQIPYRLIVVFVMFAMGIGITGYLYYKDQKDHSKKLNENELSAVAELKVNELFRWRLERIGDAKTIATSSHLISAILQWFQEPSSENLKKEIYLWMLSLRATYDYETVLLLDAEGAVRLSVPESDENIRTHIRPYVADAIQKKEILFTDFHKVEPTDRIHLSMIIPLSVLTKGGKHLVGAFVLEIDPGHFLYPFIQSWPIPSRTSETVLVRREGNEVVYLNDLRHQKNTALSLRFPLSQTSSPAAMAASGIEGVVEGIDYRGARVLAALRAIPHSPWFLITKIDQDEVFEPIRERARIVGFMAGLMIIGAGVILGLFWSRQTAQAEIKRLALTRHFEYLTKYANDIILLTDENLKIMEANDRALTTYGYSREELLQLTVRDLRSPETRAALDEMIDKVKEGQGIIYETYHQKKDGTTLPVEVSTRIIEIEEKNFFQAIIRDITVRKQAEQEREKLIRELQEAFSKVKTLSGLLPICASCKKIRDDKGYWNQIETYIGAHSGAEFTHGICPDCLIKLYPDLYKDTK